MVKTQAWNINPSNPPSGSENKSYHGYAGPFHAQGLVQTMYRERGQYINNLFIALPGVFLWPAAWAVHHQILRLIKFLFSMASTLYWEDSLLQFLLRILLQQWQ